jgi:hypothetical protein
MHVALSVQASACDPRLAPSTKRFAGRRYSPLQLRRPPSLQHANHRRHGGGKPFLSFLLPLARARRASDQQDDKRKSLGVKGSWYGGDDSSKESPPKEVCATAAMHVWQWRLNSNHLTRYCTKSHYTRSARILQLNGVRDGNMHACVAARTASRRDTCMI